MTTTINNREETKTKTDVSMRTLQVITITINTWFLKPQAPCSEQFKVTYLILCPGGWTVLDDQTPVPMTLAC